MNRIETIKARTHEIYDSLPQDFKERVSRLDARDELLEINNAFFYHLADPKVTYVNNHYVKYEDKVQQLKLAFCQEWWKYKFNGDDEHRGYRDDLSFAVFFQPRLTEIMRRSFNEVKYSLRRKLLMKVGAMVDKHWGQVKYDDLMDKRVKLPTEEMHSLKAMFGSMYPAALTDFEMFLEADNGISGKGKYVTDRYDTVEELLVQEMLRLESDLSDRDLRHIGFLHDIRYEELKRIYPVAKETLYARLTDTGVV